MRGAGSDLGAPPPASSSESFRTDTTRVVTSEPGSPPPATADGPELGTGAKVGRYVVLGKAGRGGMGLVYRGYDEELHRRVAIKVLYRTPYDDDGEARLLREARAIARLSHPNVVVVYEVGTVRGHLYLAMEWAEGRTLREWLEDGRRSPSELLAAFVAAGRGLAAAHAAGLVHRDFKPANVIVSDGGRVRVLDFGLARAHDAPESEERPEIAPAADDPSLSEPLTQAGIVLGTPRYMAPEQHLGRPATAAVDQYAFCVALYDALFGVRAFPGSGPGELLEAKMLGPPRPPRDRRIPKRVVRAILRGLSPRVDDRWPSMDALLAALDRRAPRRKLMLAVTGGGALAVAAALAYRSPQGPSCDSGPDRLAEAYDESQREAITTAFSATELPFAGDATRTTLAGLDRYGDEWLAAYRDACEATHVRGEQSVATLDLRMECLAGRLGRMAAAVEVLTTADAGTVEASRSVVGSLPAIDACGDVGNLRASTPLPSDPVAREVLEGVRERVSPVDAMCAAGRVSDGLARLDAEQATVEELDHPPLTTQVMRSRGKCLAGDDPTAAREALEAAVLAAARSRDQRLVAMLFGDLYHHVGYVQGEYDEAAGIEIGARAALERLDEVPWQEETDLLNSMALIGAERGQLEAAEATARKTLAMLEGHDEATPDVVFAAQSTLAMILATRGSDGEAEKLYGAALDNARLAFGGEHPLVARAHSNLAAFAIPRGRLDEGEAHAKEALRIYEAAYGPDTYQAAPVRANYAVILLYRGRFEEARAQLLSVLEANRRMNPKHETLGIQLTNLAATDLELHRFDDAERWATEALELFAENTGSDNYRRVAPLDTLAQVARVRGNFAVAIDYATQAVDVATDALGEHPLVGITLVNKGDILREAGRPEDARPLIERGLKLLEREGTDPAHLAAGRFALGRVLPPEERERAERLVRAARDGFREGGDAYVDEVRQADAWLAGRID